MPKHPLPMRTVFRRCFLANFALDPGTMRRAIPAPEYAFMKSGQPFANAETRLDSVFYVSDLPYHWHTLEGLPQTAALSAIELELTEAMPHGGPPLRAGR